MTQKYRALRIFLLHIALKINKNFVYKHHYVPKSVSSCLGKKRYNLEFHQQKICQQAFGKKTAS